MGVDSELLLVFSDIVRSGVYSLLGTPTEWIEKSMLDTIRTVRKDTNAKIKLIEARPRIKGTPWLLDPGMDVEKASGVK